MASINLMESQHNNGLVNKNNLTSGCQSNIILLSRWHFIVETEYLTIATLYFLNHTPLKRTWPAVDQMSKHMICNIQFLLTMHLVIV